MGLSRLIRPCVGGHLSLTHYAPHETGPVHRHEGAQVSLVLAGAYREDSPAGPVEAEDGFLSGKPPGHEHQTAFGAAGALILTINLHDAPFLDGYFAGCRGVDRTALTAAVIDDDPSAVAALCGGETADVTPARAAPWLIRARDRLAGESQLKSGALAREVGLHPVRFAGLFHRAFGRAPNDLRQSHRTARAINRIVRTSVALADIACDEGFADQAHMTRRVRCATGLPPARLRRMFAAG